MCTAMSLWYTPTYIPRSGLTEVAEFVQLAAASVDSLSYEDEV